MALKIELLDDEENDMATNNWTADRDLYLDASRERAVEAGDPAAAFLLCREGRVVKAALVEWYKLKNKPKRKPKKPSADKAEKPTGDKGKGKK